MVNYQLICSQMEGLCSASSHFLPVLSNASALLFDSLDNVNWAGFYLMQDEGLILGPFNGKPACVLIPVGKGVCGSAVKENNTLLVKDVHQFPGHIACDSASNSEIVIPFHDEKGRIIGVLDIDSPLTGRFNDEDRKGLEAFVHVIESHMDFSSLKEPL